MHTISVTLPVLKALTDLLIADDQSYDDVLRELLKVDSVVEPEREVDARYTKLASAITPHLEAETRFQHGKGFVSRSLFLPEGTELRARYKGKLYQAVIRNEYWIGPAGQVWKSPSAAATAITDTTVNGLRFWEAKRPGDTIWRHLDKFL
jgi:hypothetical protein